MVVHRLNYLVGGLNPRGYHVINVALHALTAILFTRLCRQVALLDGKMESVAAGLMFAVHPIHTEAVSDIFQRRCRKAI